MKEISDVIKEYEYKENTVKLEKVYREFQFKIKLLLKNDLYEIDIIDNIDEYTKISDFTIPLLRNGRHFYLYRNIFTKNLYYISTGHNNLENSIKIIKTDHISSIDTNILLKKALREQQLHVKKTNGFADLLFGMAVIIVIFALFIFILNLEEGFLSFVLTTAFLVVAFVLFALGTILNQLEEVKEKLSKLEEK